MSRMSDPRYLSGETLYYKCTVFTDYRFALARLQLGGRRPGAVMWGVLLGLGGSAAAGAVALAIAGWVAAAIAFLVGLIIYLWQVAIPIRRFVSGLSEHEKSPAGSMLSATIHSGEYRLVRNGRVFELPLRSIVHVQSFLGIAVLVSDQQSVLFVPTPIAPPAFQAGP
jgi:hypothetical protein